ncbi:hypothetical protein EV697_102251 [Bisgaardia hudsonensis]|uniref:Uncharacterized protein n=1 Tax=Bisgaardia hudsonensis TaxID=109472 RepID=A0A4R2N1E7_9PAST|nr:hypothetical protein [Bisgaardia hudsonensis]QLB13064.1 hypothetical protein A6A11_05280 [Bisgaardia hudsonensis]TCP13369.1 hypothetical protein EV697_102251 [Bisgaardia hudsonensis]
MNCEIKFKKRKIILAILINCIFLLPCVLFVIYPEAFMDHFHASRNHIILFGTFYVILLFSYIRILLRKVAVIVNDTYLIDNSRYEAIGKIDWNDILEIKKISKKSLRITFKKPIFETRNMFFIKKFLLFMLNWDYKHCIIISSFFFRM